jgi:hypothetical protein
MIGLMISLSRIKPAGKSVASSLRRIVDGLRMNIAEQQRLRGTGRPQPHFIRPEHGTIGHIVGSQG